MGSALAWCGTCQQVRLAVHITFDEKRMKHLPTGLLIFMMMLLSGCSSMPSSFEDYQKYYATTRWYFAEHRLRLDRSDPCFSAFHVTDNHGAQIFFTSPAGIYIYTEMEPDWGIKTFHGDGTLNELPGVSEPIFEKHCDYTQRHPGSILLIGFVGNRMFELDANQSNLDATVDLARNLRRRLLAQQSADRGASNKTPEDTARKLADPQR